MKLSTRLKGLQASELSNVPIHQTTFDRVIAEAEALEAQIESLKNCCNCKHYIFENNESHCYYRDTDKRGHCNSGNDFELWEMPVQENE